MSTPKPEPTPVLPELLAFAHTPDMREWKVLKTHHYREKHSGHGGQSSHKAKSGDGSSLRGTENTVMFDSTVLLA